MEGVPGAAEEPAGVGPGQGVDAGGLGVGEADGRDVRGAGQSRGGGNGVSAGGTCRSAGVMSVSALSGTAAGPGAGTGSPPVFPLARKARKKMIRIMAMAVRKALCAAGDEGATVADLMAACGMGRSWVYYRLGELADAGRAVQATRGTWRAIVPGDAP